MSHELESFQRSLEEVFQRLGLPDPVLVSQIKDEWEELAGTPWSGRSQPLFVQGKTLIVEAASPSTVAFLRYGEAALIEALVGRFGEGVIDSIEVRPPPRT